MPKKATEGAAKKPTPKHNDATLAVVESITKTFGENVAVRGTDILNQKKVIIPVCPTLDIALNGGIQEGGIVTMSGPPRCGKTTTSLHFAATCQQPEYGSRQVVYINAEARLEKRDIAGIPGLNVDDMIIIQASPPEEDANGVLKPGKILTAEELLDIAERFLMNTTRCVVILDSISIMCEEAEWTGGLSTQTRGGAQKLFAQFIRRMTQVIPTNKHIFIGIVHLMANTSGQGPKWLEKLSNSGQYALSTKLRCEYFEPWNAGTEKDKTQIGQMAHWKCDRTPLGPPGVKITSYLRYGVGVDEIYEYMQFAIDLNMIKQSGSWYTLEFLAGEGKSKKLQGAEAVRHYLSTNSSDYEMLKASVREGMGP